MRRVLLVGLLLVSLSTVVGAITPEEATKLSFEYAKEQRWSDVAALMDTAAMESLREMMLSVFLAIPDSMEDAGLSAIFGAEMTKDKLRGMSAAEFTTFLLSKLMGMVSQMGQIRFESQEVLGNVIEKDTLCHVVTRARISMGEASLEQMEIVSFVKRGNEWKMLLKGEFKGLVEQIRKMSEMMKDPQH